MSQTRAKRPRPLRGPHRTLPALQSQATRQDEMIAGRCGRRVAPPAAVPDVTAVLLDPARGGEESAHSEDLIPGEGLILLDVVPKMTFGVLAGHLAHLAEGLRTNETPWECLHLWWGPWSSKPVAGLNKARCGFDSHTLPLVALTLPLKRGTVSNGAYFSPNRQRPNGLGLATGARSATGTAWDDASAAAARSGWVCPPPRDSRSPQAQPRPVPPTPGHGPSTAPPQKHAPSASLLESSIAAAALPLTQVDPICWTTECALLGGIKIVV
jgi:hypothetical protein